MPKKHRGFKRAMALQQEAAAQVEFNSLPPPPTGYGAGGGEAYRVVTPSELQAERLSVERDLAADRAALEEESRRQAAEIEASRLKLLAEVEAAQASVEERQADLSTLEREAVTNRQQLLAEAKGEAADTKAKAEAATSRLVSMVPLILVGLVAAFVVLR